MRTRALERTTIPCTMADGCKFLFSSAIRGFHVYGKIWSPRVAQQLQTVKTSLLRIRHRVINLHTDASNYVQRHLTMSGSDTFLLWTFSQVGNLPLWSLRIRVKQAQRTACRRAPERVLFFRARDARARR